MRNLTFGMNMSLDGYTQTVIAGSSKPPARNGREGLEP